MHYRKNLLSGEWVLLSGTAPQHHPDVDSPDIYQHYSASAYEQYFSDGNTVPLIGLSHTELYDYFRAYAAWITNALNNCRDIMIHSIIKPSCTLKGTERESHLTIVPDHPDFLDRCIESVHERYEDKHICPLCEVICAEIEYNQRVISQTERFVAFCPFFQRFPYETLIAPLAHSPHFSGISDEMLHEFSLICHDLFNRIYDETNKTDFSIHLHHIFVPVQFHYCTHWYLDIIPRTANWAGFEIATGININTTVPEHCVKNLSKIN
ncbi:hypothetical protein KDK77_07415 [bacterium]|nr:hypothetical protein [bacterium]MCP5462199.1 hypothetical protein [bacterium]